MENPNDCTNVINRVSVSDGSHAANGSILTATLLDDVLVVAGVAVDDDDEDDGA
jgi:hypothetical protein